MADTDSTHYVGDDCPGGHFEEHMVPPSTVEAADYEAREMIERTEKRLDILKDFVASKHPEWHDSPVQTVTTHVWCESDGNNGVVPATHRVYHDHRDIPPHPRHNPFCDGSRATHYPLHRGAPQCQ